MELKGRLTPPRILALALLVRLASVFIVQTSYVPDEYWQSLEVAHKFAFGYGELTWEWSKGIRSYLYPAVFTGLYKILYYTGWDNPDVVILLPRVFQAVLSAVADYSFYMWSGKRKWALFLTLSSWFWFYTASRTLANTLETSLVTIALSIFPFKGGKVSHYAPEDNRWLWLAVLTCHVRPTAAVLWAPLVAYNFLTTNQPRTKLLTLRYLPITLISLSALTAIDSYFHGDLLFSPWEFFKANILSGVGSFYGQHPWYWYLYQGLPVVLGVNTLVAAWAAFKALRRPRENTVQVLLLGVAALHVAVHSAIPHKEFRFVLPLLPLFLYLVQDVLAQWSRKAKKYIIDDFRSRLLATSDDLVLDSVGLFWDRPPIQWIVTWQIYLAAGVLLVGNAVPAGYTALWHQRGTLDVMRSLRQITQADAQASILFLTPCHSTPLYSHLHVNVTTRYLSCEPPLESIGEVDESERFYQNPARWWSAQYADQSKPRTAPTHVVLFNSLQPRLQAQLKNYRLLEEIWHTHFPEGNVSEKLLLLERANREPMSRSSAPPLPPTPVDEAL